MKATARSFMPPHATNCDCISCSTYALMYQWYPKQWYETTWAMYAMFFSIALGGLWLQVQFGLYPNRWVTAWGVGVYLIGYVIDIYATDRAHRIKPLFDKRGLDFPGVEANPLLPANPTLQEQIFSRSSLLYVLALPVIVLSPTSGMGMGIVKMVVGGLGNLKARTRTLATLQYIDEMGPRGVKVGYSSSSRVRRS